MARTSRPLIAFVQFLIFIGILHKVNCAYFGKPLGKLSELHHGVSGEVYVVDARTLYLKDFTYDGQGPAAYFYAGSSRSPGNGGFRLKDEKGSPAVIRRYRKEGVTLSLPEGKTLNNIKWFSVWCEEFEVNFGDVKIPRNFDYPRPRKIDALKGVHGISSDNIVIVDAQTLLVPNLSYDGEAPDAKFWVGRSSKPSPQGVRVADENGKEVPLRRYDRKTVVLTLPGDLTIFDIGHFGIWCEAFTVDFGHIQIPHNLNVPPSLKMLGVSPQKRPRGFEFSEVPRRQAQLVGGQLEATTFRPQQYTRQFAQPHQQPLIAQHRSDLLRPTNQDNNNNRHEVVNRAIYTNTGSINNNPNSISQNYNNQIQQLVPIQQTIRPTNQVPINNQIQQVPIQQSIRPTNQVPINNQIQQSIRATNQVPINNQIQQVPVQNQIQPSQQFLFNGFGQQQQAYNNQQFLHQQQLLNQQKLLQQLLFTQQLRQLNLQQYPNNQPYRYFPIVHPDPQPEQTQQPQQQVPLQIYQQQLLYNQLLQNHRFQEEQRLRELNRQQISRVDSSGNNNNNNYITQG